MKKLTTTLKDSKQRQKKKKSGYLEELHNSYLSNLKCFIYYV